MSAISRQQVVSSSNSNTNSNDLFVINNAQTNSDSSPSSINENTEENTEDDDDKQLNKTFLTEKDMKIFDDMFIIEENSMENKENGHSIQEEDEEKIDINLPLNLNLITVTETETEPITFRTKKFYESDDTIINQIFSQTIQSAGVTPTDEYEIFSFESNDDDHEQKELKEKTGVGDWITVDEQIPNNCGGGSGGVSQTDSHTENLDNFMENDGLKSLIETATNNILNGIEDDFIDYDVSSEVNIIYENLPTNSETQPPSINEIDPNLNIYENVIFENNEDEPIDETIYENIIVDTTPRVSIVVDCYDDQQERSEPFYVEPLTPQNEKSYFDTTIEDEDFDELNNKNKQINQTTNINILTNDEDEIISDDNMVTYSDETDSDDEEIDDIENLINDEDGVDNHSCINVHVSFKSFFFINNLIFFLDFGWLNYHFLTNSLN